ncbi:MAG: YebC/PmpR family DNA-binding transcriptional regulator [Patescibacteria group bacterium]|nr:YebC/PmpR family DNA-binding transcriptional regulator [Patescibacteria group bacterium]
MSGHSKWSTIKHKKATTDAKKANTFARLARDIAVAARSGGDPEANFRLRLAIDKARADNMPNKNIERAIQRGSGGSKEGVQIEEAVWEAYGPGQVAVLIKVAMENKNKALMEIKNILRANQGKFVEGGGVSWQFKKIGIIMVGGGEMEQDDLEMLFIESGAQDYHQKSKNRYSVFTAPSELQNVSRKLATELVEILDEDLGYLAKNVVEVDEKTKTSCSKLLEELKENDNVVAVYNNGSIT